MHPVLIVDDDDALRKVLRLRLARSGFEPFVAAHADDAIQMIESRTCLPHCILLDNRLPGKNGLDLLPEIRHLCPTSPVVMLTASADIETGVEAMRRGAFDYLVKPVVKDQLLATIRKALSYRKIQIENDRLAAENREYQDNLERKVHERTRELSRAHLQTVAVLAETIEAKDPYTRGHCNRVRLLSISLGRALEIGKEELRILEYGSILHDIGKIGVPEGMLNKNGRLTAQETEVFRAHPVLGESILRPVDFFRDCLPIVRWHHEWYDGGGYPDGLVAEDIPLLVRIVAIADAFDAMTSARPYRSALSLETAYAEIRSGCGSQFDPEIGAVFLEREIWRRLDGIESTGSD